LRRDRLAIPVIKGAGKLGKMTSPGGKLTALACHPTKKLNKAEELTYLSSNIEFYWLTSLSNKIECLSQANITLIFNFSEQ